MPNWNFRGVFSPYIIYNAGGISAAAIAGDIIFFSLAGPVGDYTGPILCFFAIFFLYFIRQKVYRSCDGRSGGQGEHNMINMTIREPCSSLRVPSGPSSSRAAGSFSYCDGRGGAQRPVWRGNAPKKTGARSARARTRGQNPLVNNIFKLLLHVIIIITCKQL